jgi:uncharacterized protein YjbJ (UPF0337 family)
VSSRSREPAKDPFPGGGRRVLRASAGRLRRTSVGGMYDDHKTGLENETKGRMKETEGKFRGDLGRAIGDTSEHLKGRA